MDKIAVLIPCYNEEQTIGKVIRDWKEYLPDAVIYVYDNNSTDKTAELALQAGAIVRHESRQGKGNVIRRMFREIDSHCYIMVDGDDTYSAKHGPQMAQMVIEQQADMVIGDRLSSTYFQTNKRPFHNTGNSLVRGAINKLFKTDIQDIMTGYRALSYLFAKSFPVLSKGFEIETEMTIHAVDKNMNVQNLVIDYQDRPEGSQSKLNTYSDGIKVIGTIFRLFKNYRPMMFFGTLAGILLTVSVSMFIPILLKFFKTGLVPNFPTLIVSGFIAMSAITSWFTGMLLETIVEKDRQAFEFRLHVLERMKNQAET